MRFMALIGQYIDGNVYHAGCSRCGNPTPPEHNLCDVCIKQLEKHFFLQSLCISVASLVCLGYLYYWLNLAALSRAWRQYSHLWAPSRVMETINAIGPFNSSGMNLFIFIIGVFFIIIFPIWLYVHRDKKLKGKKH